VTDPTGAPAGQMDLLTAVMHEMGEQLGLQDAYTANDRDGLMYVALTTGERKLPSAADVAASANQTGMAEPQAASGQAVGPAPANINVPAAQDFVGQHIVNGFDAQYYLAHNPDVAAAGVDPLVHFNTHGWQEGRNPNAFFDTKGYLAHYADVAAAGVNPLEHYEQSGWKEGRDPSAQFDTQGYLAANPDVAATHANPLDHYLQQGVHEGRTPINDGLWH
jgi:hypothetical protein